jgi:hypothetical protein
VIKQEFKPWFKVGYAGYPIGYSAEKGCNVSQTDASVVVVVVSGNTHNV